MKFNICLLISLGLFTAVAIVRANETNVVFPGRIQPWPKDPRYWQ